MKNKIFLLVSIIFPLSFLHAESLTTQQQIFLNFCQNTAQHIKNLTDKDEKLSKKIDELNETIAYAFFDSERKIAEKEKQFINEERKRSEEKIRELIQAFTICNPYIQVTYQPSYSHYPNSYNR